MKPQSAMRRRFGDQMLAAAEADFKPHAFNGRLEQCLQAMWSRLRDVDRQLRQQRLDQV